MRFIYSKLFFWFASSICVAALAILLQTKGWFGPIQQFFLYLPRPLVTLSKNIVYPVQGFIQNLYSVRSIVRENGDLERKVSQLQERVVSLQGVQGENEQLRHELGFIQKSELILEPCTVLAQDPEGVTNSLVLNCGSNEGVAQGQAVVSGGFLIGKIFIANNSTSTVTLLTSSDFSVGSGISGTEVTGLLKGSFGSGITMDLISQTAELKSGDLIVTAGLNNSIPKNILIGEVGDTVSVANDLFKKVTVKSPVNFKNLDYVFVVR